MPRELSEQEVIGRLATFCAERGSQRVAAAHLHVSEPMISQMIHGKRAVPVRILSVLGVVRRRRIVVQRQYFEDRA